MRTFLLGSVVVVLALCPSVRAQTFTDAFEGPALDNFWTIWEERTEYCEWSFSTDEQVDGASSLKMYSEYGAPGVRYCYIRHDFDSPVQGRFTVWFFDHLDAIYAGMGVDDPAAGVWTSIGIADYDPWYYYVGAYPAAIRVAPRSYGWHKFEIHVDDSGSACFIDGEEVSHLGVPVGITRILLGHEAPSWRPTGTVYYDAFAYEGPGVEFMRGDANGDGQVSVADIVNVLNYLFVPGSDDPDTGVVTCRDAADANDDERLTLTDALKLVSYIAGRCDALPEPFGACGLDPLNEADLLDCASYAPCP